MKKINNYDEVWTRIMYQTIEKLSKKPSLSRNEMKKGIVALVKGLNATFDERRKVPSGSEFEYINKVWNNFQLCEMTMVLIGRLTPEELVQIFPAEKIYDGDKYQVKDWFSTSRAVKNLSKGKPIAESEEVFEFLWDYHSWELNTFTVNVMSAMSDINKLEKNKGLFEQFMEEQGYKTYTTQMDGTDIIGFYPED